MNEIDKACPIESTKINNQGTGRYNLESKGNEIIDRECFAEVKGYLDYHIGNRGTFLSKKFGKRRVMKPGINSNGYFTCVLTKDGSQVSKTIHRLVCEAFIPNPENKPQINHINGDKLDNRVCNLEWVTNGENQTHAYANGLNYTSISTAPILAENEQGEVMIFNSIKDAANALDTNSSNISRYCKSGKPLNGYSLRRLHVGVVDINCGIEQEAQGSDPIIIADKKQEAFLKDILNRQEARKQEPIIVAEEPLINCLRCKNFRLMDYMVSDSFNCKLVNGASCYHAIRTDNCNFEFARNITILSKKENPCDCNKGAD